MEYSEELREKIHKTTGVDPIEHSDHYVRNVLEDLLDEISTMVFGHIGIEKVTEDVIITYSEINALERIRSVYGDFMEVYEEFLDKNNKTK